MMTKISYRGYRFPPGIIQHAIWLYVRFTLSFRDIEDLLAERGIVVSHETVPKRHLNTHYGLTPEQYREKWGLPRDYPMVAPAYAAARSDLAKNIGLGRRAGTDKPAAEEKAAKSVSKRARKAA
jgi:ROS/MUCR transcriptional regulator protein